MNVSNVNGTESSSAYMRVSKLGGSSDRQSQSRAVNAVAAKSSKQKAANREQPAASNKPRPCLHSKALTLTLPLLTRNPDFHHRRIARTRNQLTAIISLPACSFHHLVLS